MNQPAFEEFTDEAIDLGELTSSVGLLLRLAQVQVFQQFFSTLAGHGLKPGEFSALWVIGLNPGVRQGSLARRLRIKPAHMTKLVQRMVHAEYVSRTIPPDDRRSVRLSLTESGKAFVEAHKPEFLDFQRVERAALSDEEYEELVRLLRKFIGLGEVK